MPDLNLLFASQWGALMIFGLRIVDVSLETMRVIFTIRGRRDIAAIPPVVQERLRAAGLRFDVMQTGAAARTWNVLLAEDRRVAAALIAVP